MKATLIVNRITENIEENFGHIVDFIRKSPDDTDLVLFPEAAITGLINNDEPEHDLLLGIPIPSRYTEILSNIALERNLHIGIGILERDGNRLYDSAILIDSSGKIALKYRRITSGWHGPKADSKVYSEGSSLKVATTSLGAFAFLICGDLFDDALISQIRKLRLDFLLYPLARSFDDGSYDKERWEKEKREYIERIKLAGITTFMVNYLADKEFDGGSFGGAMVVSPEGKIVAEMPIGNEGMLEVEV